MYWENGQTCNRDRSVLSQQHDLRVQTDVLLHELTPSEAGAGTQAGPGLVHSKCAASAFLLALLYALCHNAAAGRETRSCKPPAASHTGTSMTDAYTIRGDNGGAEVAALRSPGYGGGHRTLLHQRVDGWAPGGATNGEQHLGHAGIGRA